MPVGAATVSKKTIIISLALIMTPMATLAQEGQHAKNGTLWNQVSYAQKLAYVAGSIDSKIEEMEAWAGLLKEKDPILADQLYNAERSLLTRKDGRTPSTIEIAASVDTFYQAPENLPVCEVHAVSIAWMSLAGNAVSPQALASYRNEDGKSGCK